MVRAASALRVLALFVVILLILSAQAASATAPSDDFNRPNGSVGPNWVAMSDGALSIASKAVVGTSATAGEIRTAETYGSDQSSQIQLTPTQLSGGQWIGPAVRMQSAGQNAYLGMYFWNNGAPQLRLYKRSAGTWIQLGSSYNSGRLGSGTTLQVLAVGTRISLLQNGVERVVATDTSLTGGAPGIIAFGKAKADNWVGSGATGSSGSTYSVGGSVSGLSGTVVLQDNGGDDLSVSTNGPFNFATKLAGGAAYNVTVKTNPSGQSCSVANGSGTIAAADVTQRRGQLRRQPDLLGRRQRLRALRDGRAAGQRRRRPERERQRLLQLRDQAGRRRRLRRHRQDEPERPDLQRRQRQRHDRLAADVTNVAVSCAASPTYSVGGSISGLSGTVVLRDNGGDDLTLTANGSFAFATKLAGGAAYAVTVKTNPSGQTCSVANGSGTIGSADVSNVAVSCTSNPTYAVGGSTSGLSGTVVLRNNGGDDLSVSANGSFNFATKLAGGAAYTVTVKTNPSGQSCSVANGSGTIGSADVSNVAVSCANTPTYAVGGSVSFLSGTVVLQDNGGDDLSVSTNGPFNFATKLAGGAAYNVTVKTNPSGQTCSVANGSGTIGSADVSNVAVSCAASPTYSVGGSVSGLSGTVVLQDNGGDDLSVSTNGPFNFATKLAGGAAYNVTVKTNPSGQSCSVANGSGTIGSADVSNVAVSCSARRRAAAGSDDFNRANGSLGANWSCGERRRALDLLAGGRRHERNRRRHPHRGDVHQRPVVADRAHLDAALGRAVGRPDRAHAERRPGHLPRDLLLERRQSRAAPLQAQRRHLDPARQLLQLRGAAGRHEAAAERRRLDDLVPARRRHPDHRHRHQHQRRRARDHDLRAGDGRQLGGRRRDRRLEPDLRGRRQRLRPLGDGRVAGQRRRRPERQHQRPLQLRDQARRRRRLRRHRQDEPERPELQRRQRQRHDRLGRRQQRRRHLQPAPPPPPRGTDDFNRANGSLGANWTAVSDGALSISSQAVDRHERNRRRHPHRGDVHQRPVVPDRAHLDAALGRAVGRPDRAHAERRPEHLPRDLLLERRQSRAAPLQAQRRHLDPARQLLQRQGRCPPARRCS